MNTKLRKAAKKREDRRADRIAKTKRNIFKRQLNNRKDANRVSDRGTPGHEPIRFNKEGDELPLPRRNEPCPLHPDHKLKNCPHGCLHTVFLHARMEKAGDTVRQAVKKTDQRLGMVGRPTTSVAARLTNSLVKATEGEVDKDA